MDIQNKHKAETHLADGVVSILQSIGEEPFREGLRGTPERVARAYLNEIFSGYKTDIGELMTTFTDGACDEMVVLKNIEFVSFCEHHMLPFSGVAHIGYIPDGKVIGVSKLARVLDAFAKRLQIQERICQQVTDALKEHLKPKGAGCVLEARHLCMVCRGVQKQNATMVTSSLYGRFVDQEVRSEFLSLIK